MALLIDTLLQNPIKRNGLAGLSTRSRRPRPGRTRDMLEVLAALGATGTFAAFRRSVDMKAITAVEVGNIVLGRWLTSAELAALPAPYEPFEHICAMLLSAEFRASLARRICDIYYDKRRIISVAVPGIASRYTLDLWDTHYPVLPRDLCDSAYDKRDTLTAALGKLLQRVVAGKTICLAVPRLAEVIDMPPPPLTTQGIGWEMHTTPFRLQDLLYAVLRTPESHALSMANTAVARLRGTATPKRAARAAGLEPGNLPDANDDRGWRDLALRLVREQLPHNPVCTALGDGTAATAIANCVRLPIELVALEDYSGWCNTNFEMPPIDLPDPVPRVIRAGDLGAAERAAIAARLGEDAIFHARFSAHRKAGLPAVMGPELAG